MITVVTSETQTIPYSLKISNHSRSIRITIHRDSSVIVTVPRKVDNKKIEEFISAKSLWIKKVLDRFSKNPRRSVTTHTQKEIQQYMEQGDIFVTQKLLHFNQTYRFTWKKVAIKNVSSRWGSCSSKGHLYFNYKIVLLPERLAEYIVVHELCHLGECNHSPRFWALVAKTIPDYKERRKELRTW